MNVNSISELLVEELAAKPNSCWDTIGSRRLAANVPLGGERQPHY